MFSSPHTLPLIFHFYRIKSGQKIWANEKITVSTLATKFSTHNSSTLVNYYQPPLRIRHALNLSFFHLSNLSFFLLSILILFKKNVNFSVPLIRVSMTQSNLTLTPMRHPIHGERIRQFLRRTAAKHEKGIGSTSKD